MPNSQQFGWLAFTPPDIEACHEQDCRQEAADKHEYPRYQPKRITVVQREEAIEHHSASRLVSAIPYIEQRPVVACVGLST